jgi:hypothetical protein
MSRSQGKGLGALGVLVGLLAASSVHASEVRFRGLLDLVAVDLSHALELNQLTRGDSPFDAARMRAFADATVNSRVQVFAQAVMGDGADFYLDGAYVVVTPDPQRDAHALIGKIPSAIGTYAPRTYSDKNPLIGAPLMYQYHTSLVFYSVAPNTDVLLAAAGTGQRGVNYFGYTMGRGMPLVDDSYWDVGITLTGSQRPLEYALGVTQGTPGWASTPRDENNGKTVLGRVGFAPVPAVRVGVSGAFGPYLSGVEARLPAGKGVNDYHQKLAMADAELSLGHIELRGEGARNVWETPAVGDLEVTSGYVELKYLLDFGGYLAGRFDVERFGKVAPSSGADRPWDLDVTRYEIGAGYRFDTHVRAKAVYQGTTRDAGAPGIADQDESLVAAQLSVAF